MGIVIMSFFSKAAISTILGSLLISLSACDSSSTSTSPQAKSEAVVLSTELQGIYDRSCKNCHTIENTGAPLTGDANAWNKILAQGIEPVVDNAMQGIGGMPPAGQCFECTPDQIKSLILYMANPAN